jgi:hypothetical protein
MDAKNADLLDNAEGESVHEMSQKEIFLLTTI